MPFGQDKREQDAKAREAAVAAANAPQPNDPGQSFEDGLEKALSKALGEEQAAPADSLAHPAAANAGAGGDGAPPLAGSDPAGSSPPGAGAAPQSGVAGSNQAEQAQQDAILAALGQIDPRLAQKYKSGEEALRGFAHAQQYLGQKSQLEQLGEFVQTNPYAAYQNLRNVYGDQAPQPPQPTQAAQPAQATKEEEEPEFDPLWLRSAMRNPQTGKWEDVPGGLDGAAANLEKYERHYIEKQRRAVADPLSNPRVKKAIEEKYVSRDEFANLAKSIKLQAEQQQAAQEVSRLAHKLFVPRSPYDQGPVMRTAWGDLFVGKVAEAESLGVGVNPRTGETDYNLQNRWAESQADLLFAYQSMAGAVAQQGGIGNHQAAPQPTQQAAPQVTRQVPPGLAPGGGSVPAPRSRDSDTAGLPPPGDQDRLEALLNNRLAGALERGEIAQSQLSAFSRAR